MKTIEQIDLSTLSLDSLCEIYAATNGICMGYTEAGKKNLIANLEYNRSLGKVVLPSNPSKRFLTEINLKTVCVVIESKAHNAEIKEINYTFE